MYSIGTELNCVRERAGVRVCDYGCRCFCMGGVHGQAGAGAGFCEVLC